MICLLKVMHLEIMPMTWRKLLPSCTGTRWSWTLPSMRLGWFSANLSFILSHQGIEANLEKIWVVRQIRVLRMVKEVQRLAGKIAALNWFIFRSAERCLPFFQTLKKPKDFRWIDECWKAFEEFNVYLSTPLLLSKPEAGEELYLYLTVSPHPSDLYWFERKIKYRSQSVMSAKYYRMRRLDILGWRS